MPIPKDGESHDDWMARCIPKVLDDGTAKNQDQAVAICMNIWRESDSNAKAIARCTKLVADYLRSGRSAVLSRKDDFEDRVLARIESDLSGFAYGDDLLEAIRARSYAEINAVIDQIEADTSIRKADIDAVLGYQSGTRSDCLRALSNWAKEWVLNMNAHDSQSGAGL